MIIQENYLKYFFYVIVICLIIITLATPLHRVKAYKVITPAKVKEMMDSNTPMLLLDVRTDVEYRSGHIPTAVLMPVDTLKQDIKNKNLSKDALIIVYCHSGRRSQTAAKYLEELGFTNVYDLGGIHNKWPYELQK
ncbi:MAG: rhodanese-like domain-containing protein [Bacillota bacterium]|nr:rhodanese-like domain-containing protein [Bacillota bacterium]